MRSGIRVAIADDRPALIDLWVEAWQTAIPTIDFETRRGWIGQHLDDLVANGAAVLVAVVNGEPAGFVTVDGSGTVDQLVVALPFQKQGVAGRLVAAARLRVSGRLRLAVNLANSRAIRVYQRLGFVSVGHGTNPISGLPIQFMEG